MKYLFLLPSLIVCALTTAAAPPQVAGPWTRAITPTAEVLHAVACGNGVFVAVGDNATILNSADGRVWTAGPQPQTVERFQGVTFGGGEFVAVSGTEFWSSTDGLNWTLRANFWDPYQL